jgi:3-oxoadipate enol-lactonase/4-carboxymuconolactone decarboxylase
MTVLPHHRFDGPDDAPVLVLSNSLGTDLQMWERQMSVLTRRHRVLRYDQRGHGQTPAPPGPYSIDDLADDVVALLDHHHIERVSFCGLSLGGMVGMALASRAPERIDRFVACCTSARLGPPELWKERAELVRTGGMAAVIDAVCARWFSAAFAAADASTVDEIRAMLAATQPEGYARCCEAIGAMNLLDRLGAIAAPTLVLAAALDPATPPEHGEIIRSAIPGARLVVLPDAAHLANVEQPEAFNRAIVAHLTPEDAVLDNPQSRGQRVRREVLGDEHVARARARTTPFTADFQSFITSYAWGGIWARPGLDRRTRSAITIAMLVALGRDEELTMHLKAARRNGVSVAEIAEILLQTAVYCGVPAANHAFALATDALGEEIAPRP